MKERLTKRSIDGSVEYENGEYVIRLYHGNEHCYSEEQKAILKLAEYEDLEEQGLIGEKFCLKHSEKDYYLTEEDAKGEKACEDCREQVRKETAEEIYRMLLGTEHIKELEQKEHCEWWVSRWRIEDLNRVFKEFGVEIEE